MEGVGWLFHQTGYRKLGSPPHPSMINPKGLWAVGTAVVPDAWTLSQKREEVQALRQTKPVTASEGCRMTRLASILGKSRRTE